MGNIPRLRLCDKYLDWIAVISCSVAFCIYLNTLNAGFVYDDSRAILTNKDVLRQETPWQDILKDDFWGTPLSHSGSHKSFRPLTILSFRFNRHFSGFNPWSYHLTNIVLHTITTWLFVCVARIVFNPTDLIVFHPRDQIASSRRQEFAVLVSSLLFASHPIHTEAVAGVVGRADVTATAFALAAFIVYHHHIKTRTFTSSCKCENVNSATKKLRFSALLPAVYLVLTILLSGASILCKEHGVMIIFICMLYDIMVSLIRRSRSQTNPVSLRNLECNKSVVFLSMGFAALFSLRLSVMGGLSPPQFAKADNPTAHNPSAWTRFMTFLYLPIFNVSFLFYPYPLSYDWSMDAVRRVENLSDPRNILSVVFYVTLAKMICSCIRNIYSQTQVSEGEGHQLRSSPARNPCRICGSVIPQHQCSNNNSITFSNKEENDHSFINGQNKNLPNVKSSSRGPPIPQSLKTNNPILNGKSSNSSSPERHRHTRLKSPIWSRHKSSMESCSVFIELAFMVLPFIPASNLFLYVGFVVAERILYFPSVGFCLLIGHGWSHLYSKTDQIRRARSLVKAVVSAALIMTLIMMSLGTIRRNEDWKDEASLYRSGIAVNPPKSWGNLGNVLNSQGRVIEAEEAYRNALGFRANMAEVHYNLGLVLERQGKLEEALTSYRTAIQFRQQLAAAYVNAGQLLTRLGRINQAMDMYRNCFNLNDDGVKDLRAHVEAKVSALLRFGRLLIETEDAPKAAVKVYRQAVRIMPPDYEQKQSVYNAIGEALFRIGEIVEAERWFLEALKTKPDHVPAHLTYGKMLARNKTRLLEAERWFRRAKQIAPEDSSVYHHYGQFLAVQGRHAEAANAYVTAARLSPNDYDIVVGAANSLRQSGNNKEAEIYYEKAVALRSQEARAHMNLGAILHVNGKYHEAEQSYLMALRLKPSDEVTLLNLKKLRQLQARRNQYGASCKNMNNNRNPTGSQKEQNPQRTT